MKSIDQGSIVTIETENKTASNTVIVDSITGEQALVFHPFSPEVFFKKDIKDLDNSPATPKGVLDRSLTFVNNNVKYLDYNSKQDISTLNVAFVMNRYLTPRQKNILSSLKGAIASARLSNSIEEAMKYVVHNEKLLDEFNKMWYANFINLFKGKQPITSKKQRAVIFNIAGFVMSELENSSIY